MVVSILPARNAVAAPRTTPITITFNQPLSTTFNAGQALRVFSQQAGGQKAGVASVQGNTLTLVPSKPFQAGEQVYVTVSAVAQGSNGTPIQPQVFQFITAASPSIGSFATGYERSVPSVPYALAVGDLDGDGDLDLVTGHYNGDGTPSVRTFLNGGNNTFQNGEAVNVSVVTSTVLLSDVDGDGDLDILSAQRGGGATLVFVRRNDGAGHFSGTQQVRVGNGILGVQMGDVEGDGDLDLFTTNYIDGTVSVRLNDGAGNFGGGQDVKVGLTEQPFSATLGDVDNDGDLDLLTTYGLRLNIGNGQFSPTTQADVVGGLADLDGDGDLDLLNNGIRFNTGAGVFGPIQQAGVAGSPNDIDGDGDLDLVTVDFANGSITARRNNGSGVFGASQQVGTVSGSANPYSTANQYALADIDDNGTLDFLAVSSGPANSIIVRLNPPAVLATTTAAKSLALSVYPNPSTDHFTLAYTAHTAQAATLTLTDQLGRVVQQQAVSLGATSNQILVPTQLRAGLYHLTLDLADGQRLAQHVQVHP